MSHKFPTSEELYKRIKTDSNISSCHVSIVYFDSILNKYIDKRFAAWKEIDKGGDIPWHRVYFFKYKDKVIWDRQKKECLIDSIVASTSSNLNESFKIVSYNILNDDDNSVRFRKEEIINYVLSTDADIICLQEVSDIVMEDLKKIPNYEVAATDLKTNNVVILSKAKIHNVNLINLNNSAKQALKIIVHDSNDIDVQIFGVHLTSDHQKSAADKRKEQLAILKNHIDSNYAAFIIGDTNIEADLVISELEGFLDVAAIINDKTNTYDPSANKLALINCNTKSAKRYDRVLFNRNFQVIEYKVRNFIMCSDHYPIETTLNCTNAIKIIGEHRKTSLMLIIRNDEIDQIRRKYDQGYEKYMSHLNIFYGFIERDEFDLAFYKIQRIIQQKYLGSQLVFDKIDVLELDRHKVLCLLPNQETSKVLTAMRDEISTLLEFNMSNFCPHITLGKLDNDNDDEISLINKSLRHEMILEQLYFSEYNDNGFVEPIMILTRDVSYCKREIVNIIEKTLKKQVVIGGSSIFDDVTSNVNKGSDLDLVIYHNSKENTDISLELFEIKRKLAFTGYFFRLEIVTNQHSTYLKMKFLDDSVSIDLHYLPIINEPNTSDKATNYSKGSDIITASKYVYDLMSEINKIDSFKKSLKLIKTRFKELGIYGQTFGYLNGINILIMLGYLYMAESDVTSDTVIVRFCKLYSNWPYPNAIVLNSAAPEHLDKSSKASMLMRIPNVVYPYDNTVRNITKSTYDATIEALAHNLAYKGYEYELVVGIKCNVLYKFEAMRKFIESNIIHIILSYEDIDCKVRPLARWNIKINPENSYLYEGYITMGLSKSAICNKLQQLEQSIANMYSDQIFRFKCRHV